MFTKMKNVSTNNYEELNVHLKRHLTRKAKAFWQNIWGSAKQE